MIKQLGNCTILSLFFLSILVGCDRGNSSSGADPLNNNNGGNNSGGSTFDSLGGSGGGSNTFDAPDFGGVSDALDNIPTETIEQEEAIDDAKSAIDEFSAAFGALVEGIPLSQFGPYIENIWESREAMLLAGIALRDAGLLQLAAVFIEEGMKLDIYRLYNPTLADHHFTSSAAERDWNQLVDGYFFEGVGFRVYRQPWNGCKTPIYRCHNPQSGDHMISRDANCEGYRPEGMFGYVCDSKRGTALWGLRRYWNPTISDHMATIDPNEKKALDAYPNWNKEGILGYTPN